VPTTQTPKFREIDSGKKSLTRADDSGKRLSKKKKKRKLEREVQRTVEDYPERP